jgi:DNA-binding NtrC family response regulator
VAESTRGHGATFRIYLPCVAEGSAASAANAGIAAAERPRGHESILLVEDQEQVRELAVTVLRRAWYSVDNAADGESALMRVENRAGPLELVITNVVMPLMSGPERASRVKRRSPNTRVLYISGYSPDTFGQESPIGKEAHTLAMPFTPAQLLGEGS